MKWLGIAVGGLVAVALGFVGSIYVASELGGEVITLHRPTPDGGTSAVRLWIVDADGASWLEHGDPEAFWIQSLGEGATLRIERDGTTAEYRASTDPASHARYHELRQEKYGWADDFIGFATTKAAHCNSVPIRLEAL